MLARLRMSNVALERTCDFPHTFLSDHTEPQRDAAALGIQVAEELLDKGAGAILQKVYGEAGPQ